MQYHTGLKRSIKGLLRKINERYNEWTEVLAKEVTGLQLDPVIRQKFTNEFTHMVNTYLRIRNAIEHADIREKTNKKTNIGYYCGLAV